MRVQTKILLLMLVVVTIFGGGLVFIRAREQTKFRHIAHERAEERRRSFVDYLRREGEPLNVFTKDFTVWDPMVQAIANHDQNWLRQTVGNAWESADVHALWVYRPDRSLVFSGNRLYADEQLREVPLPPEAFEWLAKQHLAHFFLPSPQGLMEVSAATVHPSIDGYRRTPLQGFFFAARLWSNEKVAQMARESDNRVLLKLGTPPPGVEAEDDDIGVVAFTHTLEGWDGQPVAWFSVRNDSEIIRELNQSSEQLLGLLVGFALAVVVLLTVSLVRLVSRPLGRLSQTLRTQRLDPIEKLSHRRSEFGELALLIKEFFGQREKLLAEINERKLAQEALRQSGEQLRQAQKMEAVGRLAGGVAHDFNNLLTAILGYAELLAARGDFDASTHQNVQMIQKAGRQAAAVTHQLLAFSRKQILQPRVIDLSALVHDFEKILRRVIGEHIELTTVAEPGTGHVRADPNQLEQVILNLGVNARDAMPKGGQLTIRTANAALDAETARRLAPDLPPGEYVLLEVTDTGHGMDDETRSRIFEPFFTTKGPGKGTGLGLSTVYGVVKQSGGTVAVESAPGAGCTFRVYLPLDPGEVEGTRPKTVAPSTIPGKSAETVLVVEDEEIVRDLVCTVLKESGYQVLCAGNGMEALSMSAEHQGAIALMITDVVMPQMGGLELSRVLAGKRPETRVLYVSGYSENDMSEQGVLSPEADFLEKPFTPQALKRKVRDVLNPAAAALAAGGRGRDGAGWHPGL